MQPFYPLCIGFNKFRWIVSKHFSIFRRYFRISCLNVKIIDSLICSFKGKPQPFFTFPQCFFCFLSVGNITYKATCNSVLPNQICFDDTSTGKSVRLFDGVVFQYSHCRLVDLIDILANCRTNVLWINRSISHNLSFKSSSRV